VIFLPPSIFGVDPSSLFVFFQDEFFFLLLYLFVVHPLSSYDLISFLYACFELLTSYPISASILFFFACISLKQGGRIEFFPARFCLFLTPRFPLLFSPLSVVPFLRPKTFAARNFYFSFLFVCLIVPPPFFPTPSLFFFFRFPLLFGLRLEFPLPAGLCFPFFTFFFFFKGILILMLP